MPHVWHCYPVQESLKVDKAANEAKNLYSDKG